MVSESFPIGAVFMLVVLVIIFIAAFFLIKSLGKSSVPERTAFFDKSVSDDRKNLDTIFSGAKSEIRKQRAGRVLPRRLAITSKKLSQAAQNPAAIKDVAADLDDLAKFSKQVEKVSINDTREDINVLKDSISESEDRIKRLNEDLAAMQKAENQKLVQIDQRLLALEEKEKSLKEKLLESEKEELDESIKGVRLLNDIQGKLNNITEHARDLEKAKHQAEHAAPEDKEKAEKISEELAKKVEWEVNESAEEIKKQANAASTMNAKELQTTRDDAAVVSQLQEIAKDKIEWYDQREKAISEEDYNWDDPSEGKKVEERSQDQIRSECMQLISEYVRKNLLPHQEDLLKDYISEARSINKLNVPAFKKMIAQFTNMALASTGENNEDIIKADKLFLNVQLNKLRRE